MSTARYDSVADSYGLGFDVNSVSATRELLEMVGPVEGQRVLDIACGHGPISRLLAGRGARRVTGLDLSTRLIQRAREDERLDPLGVDYIEADASSQTALPGATFDLAVSNFGLSDIDDLDGLCKTVARVLVPGGRFVFSILHPCFSGSPGVSGSWAAEHRYYDEMWWAATGEHSTLRQEVGANHRMISTYLNSLRGEGLLLDALREPEPDQDLIERSPEMASLPIYLVARCVRGPS